MDAAINEAFDNLKTATRAYYQRQIRKVETKFAHDAAYETGLVSGEIMGKNEQERMGVMRSFYPQLVEDYEGARLAELGAEMAYRLALLEKERVGLLVQIGGKPPMTPEGEGQ